MQTKPLNESTIAASMRSILVELGEDPDRDGLMKTPQRVEDSLRFLTKGYAEDPVAVMNEAMFDVEHSEMIIVKDIGFYSLCEHHMLPFFGRVHVGYIPSKKIVGLSKIPRLIEVFARRLQVQERMTNQIAEIMMDLLKPAGVGVVIEAEHLCMQMRGIQKQNSQTLTSAMRGEFLSNKETRREFLGLVKDG